LHRFALADIVSIRYGRRELMTRIENARQVG